MCPPEPECGKSVLLPRNSTISLHPNYRISSSGQPPGMTFQGQYSVCRGRVVAHIQESSSRSHQVGRRPNISGEVDLQVLDVYPRDIVSSVSRHTSQQAACSVFSLSASRRYELQIEIGLPAQFSCKTLFMSSNCEYIEVEIPRWILL